MFFSWLPENHRFENQSRCFRDGKPVVLRPTADAQSCKHDAVAHRAGCRVCATQPWHALGLAAASFINVGKVAWALLAGDACRWAFYTNMFDDITFTFEPGKVIKVFSQVETNRIENDWMGVFCKERQGVNTKAYKWHIFSWKRFPSLEGEQALQEYAHQISREYIILPNAKQPAVLVDAKPATCSLADYYVFPPNLAWVLAFTHESGWLGPYFAKHPNYEFLNSQNIAFVKKANERARAIQKGWATASKKGSP